MNRSLVNFPDFEPKSCSKKEYNTISYISNYPFTDNISPIKSNKYEDSNFIYTPELNKTNNNNSKSFSIIDQTPSKKLFYNDEYDGPSTETKYSKLQINYLSVQSNLVKSSLDRLKIDYQDMKKQINNQVLFLLI